MGRDAPSRQDNELRVEKLFFHKIADEWEAIVTTGRIRRKHRTQKEKDELRGIEKQERLEWEQYLREKGEM